MQEKTMGKMEFLKVLAKECPDLPEELVVRMGNKVIHQLAETLQKNERVEIRGFGSFAPKYRETRLLRNPLTGEQVEVPARRIPRFKAGKILSKRVNQPR